MFGKSIAVIKNNLNEFKDFAFKGNLLQLAIGVVLGAAFGKLIESFVKNLFVPLINVVTGGGGAAGGYERWQWKGINFGAFLAEFINFTIIAFAIFLLMVKVVGLISKLAKKKPDGTPADPTEKDCNYCMMKVPYKATKCGHCTSDLSLPA